MNKFYFIAILVLAGFLRMYRLGDIPNGLYQDETAIGYNAYSILQTGKDEYGKTFPLYFQSFGDWKLPVYIYVTVPSVALFGLTAFAVRLPSAIFGTATVGAVYFLVKELFARQNPSDKAETSLNKQHIAWIVMLLLAVNPWHLHYSRATFEVSAALFFFVVGEYLLMRWFRKEQRSALLAGTICFIVAMYSYNLTRLLAPVLYASSVWWFMREKAGAKQMRKTGRTEVIITLAVAGLSLIPFIGTLFMQGGSSSAAGTLLFSSAAVQAPLLELRSYFIHLPAVYTKLFFNQFVLTAWEYLRHIASYFSVNFFFLTGSSHGNHGIGNSGQFYLFELPLMVIGVGALIRKQYRQGVFLALWAVAVILVSALTRESPHATRSFFLLLPMTVVSALGIMSLMGQMRRMYQKKIGLMVSAAAGGFILYSAVYYFTSYYVRFPVAYAPMWRSEDDAVAEFIRERGEEYPRVVFDTKAGYIYSSLLFYLAYPPGRFHEEAERFPADSEGFTMVRSFDRYEYVDIAELESFGQDTLIITTPERIPETGAVVQTFYYPERPVVSALGQRIVQYPVREAAYVAVTVH